MSHTSTRLSWAIGLGLTASTLLHGAVAAEPATTTEAAATTDTSSPTASVPPTRDQWYLDPPTSRSAPAISVQFRDRWYLDDYAPYSMQARSHRSQEEAVQIG
jgi:hypothetical protein